MTRPVVDIWWANVDEAHNEFAQDLDQVNREQSAAHVRDLDEVKREQFTADGQDLDPPAGGRLAGYVRDRDEMERKQFTADGQDVDPLAGGRFAGYVRDRDDVKRDQFTAHARDQVEVKREQFTADGQDLDPPAGGRFAGYARDLDEVEGGRFAADGQGVGSVGGGRFAGYVRDLDVVERGRLAAYVRDVDKVRFLLGVTIVRRVLGARFSLPAARVVLDRTCAECGKPHGKVRAAGMELSVTHSGALVGVAFSDRPVGLDVEKVDPGLDVDGVARVALSAGEAQALRGHDGIAKVRAFTAYWTRKEAVLKATGEGLRGDLRAETPVGIQVQALEVRGDHRAALAVVADEPPVIRVQEAASILH